MSENQMLLNHYIQKGESIQEKGLIDKESLKEEIINLKYIHAGEHEITSDGFFLIGIEDKEGNFMEFTRQSENVYDIRVSRRKTTWSEIYDAHSQDLPEWINILYDPYGKRFEEQFNPPEITEIAKKGFHIKEATTHKSIGEKAELSDSDIKLLDKKTGRIKDGLILFANSMKLLGKYPILLIPLFLSWVIVASIVLYFRYYFEFPSDIADILIIVFSYLFLIAFTISIHNLLMLEFVQQIESGERISPRKALGELININLPRVLPIVFLWALIWFIIVVIKAIIAALNSKSKSRYRSPKPSMRDAARTLGGANSGPFTWLGLGLDMFNKLVRMSVFLSLPAIAWENKSAGEALAKAKEIIRKHPIQFLTEYTVTGLAVLLMAIPLIIIFTADDYGAHFTDTFWALVIIYESIVWILANYMEQMSVALLYLWNMKWEKTGAKGNLSLIPKPSLLDDHYEFAKKI